MDCENFVLKNLPFSAVIVCSFFIRSTINRTSMFRTDTPLKQYALTDQVNFTSMRNPTSPQVSSSNSLLFENTQAEMAEPALRC